ncbi:MAG TPA: HAD-IA family hydrolase [Chloroflexia bacterium]|nr:HAD-IA family hydrolase [Chloroflexia bacterium]
MQAVIFDMDGVIVDSERHWKSLEGHFLQSIIPDWTAADQGKIIGLSVHDLYRMLVDDYGLQHAEEDFLELYHEMARDIYGRKASLLEGFEESLSLLIGKRMKVALASSSPMSWIDIVLDRFDLRDKFDIVVSADELQGEGKPSPAIYLLTARRIAVQPEECVVIEDSKNGALSAKHAGMFCVGIRNGFNDEQDLSAADMIINSFGELSWETLLDMPECPGGRLERAAPEV